MREFNFLEVLFALLRATQWTILLSIVAFIGGGILGLLITVMRVSKSRILREISKFYIAFFQARRC